MDQNERFDAQLRYISAESLSKLAKIEELKGQWIAGAKLSPQVLSRLKRSVLITSSGASTRIEGANLSDENVEKLISGLDVLKFADRDKQEVQGYFELLEKIFDSWKALKFSENSIKHFHTELLKYVDKDGSHRGEYKKTENRVEMFDADGKSKGVVFDTMPAYLTPKAMQELVEWTNNAFVLKKYHPLLIIGNFLVEFLNIHPFQDGNGRLSRILTNLLLLKSGYLYMPYVSHEKLIEDNKADYYISLRRSQKTLKSKNPDISPWLDFFLSIVLEQSEMAVKLLSEENIEKILSRKQLAVWEFLQSVNDASVIEISQKVKIARPTVKQALDKLLRLQRIERIGLGRSTRYRLINHESYG